MTKQSAIRLARLHRAAGRKVRVHRHRGVDYRDRARVFYTLSVQ
jgi:hypothetical protein